MSVMIILILIDQIEIDFFYLLTRRWFWWSFFIYNKVFLRAEVKAADVAADILYGSKCLNAIGSSHTSVCGICSNNRWKATLHARFDVSVFPALDSLWFRNCSSSSLSPRPPGACTSSSWPPMCPGDKSLTRVLQLPAEPPNYLPPTSPHYYAASAFS